MQEIISEKTKERYKGWWRNELIDRVLVQVYAPIKEKDNYFKEYEACPRNPVSFKLVKKWKERDFDNDYIVDRVKKILVSGYYAGDGFPMFNLKLGPGSLSLFAGGTQNIGY